mmetsp:Transcript_68428/g.109443  ORF Transcript_68428/g.109443 Transcript_68428/m.109443 type:complete len:336 (-) Transcript_68428:1068-2075(-)
MSSFQCRRDPIVPSYRRRSAVVHCGFGATKPCNAVCATALNAGRRWMGGHSAPSEAQDAGQGCHELTNSNGEGRSTGARKVSDENMGSGHLCCPSAEEVRCVAPTAPGTYILFTAGEAACETGGFAGALASVHHRRGPAVIAASVAVAAAPRRATKNSPFRCTAPCPCVPLISPDGAVSRAPVGQQRTRALETWCSRRTEGLGQVGKGGRGGRSGRERCDAARKSYYGKGGPKRSAETYSGGGTVDQRRRAVGAEPNEPVRTCGCGRCPAAVDSPVVGCQPPAGGGGLGNGYEWKSPAYHTKERTRSIMHAGRQTWDIISLRRFSVTSSKKKGWK